MRCWQVGIIILAVIIIFSPTLWTYFSQDDWVFLSHTYKQPFIKIFDHHPEAFYRPIGQQLFYWIGSRLFGLEAGGFHLLAVLVHLINIILLWKLFRYFKTSKYTQFLLLMFYAVNPAHFVALNWLTQIDIEIAVGFALLTILFWKRTVLALILFLGGLLAHETVAMLPIVMAVWAFRGPALTRQGRALLKSAMFFCFGFLVLGLKFLINPFSLQSDYSLNFNLFGLLSTLKWYALRALMIPEGIRNLPGGLMILSLIPGLILILMFRQKLLRGLGVYLLGVLPVLGFGGHLLAAYAVFGIALMVIELGKAHVIPAKAGIYPGSGLGQVYRFRVKPGMTMILLSVMLLLPSAIFIYSNVSKHWSTTRGLVSAKLTQDYIEADSSGKKEILQISADFVNNSEIYFSTMMGRQFEVVNRGIGRGIFGRLFYRGNDLTTQFLPDAKFFKDSILARKFPAWNPWIMAGIPYFLDPQNFLWYPPNYLLLLTPLEAGFFILLVGHLIFAGLFVRKVSDTLHKSRLIGWLGAVMFVLSPKMIGHIEEGNWSLIIAACWLPFFYWALKNKRFSWAAISLSAIIINNLNIGYYAVIFAALFDMFQKSPGLKMFLVTFLLTIPRWLPLALFGHQTVRANLQEAPLPFWSWMKIAKSLFFPLAGGHPVLQNEEILYVGIIPVILAAGYLLFKGPALLQQRGRALFWIIWLGFISLIAVNLKTFFFYLIKFLPGFSLLRITTRPWIFVPLALAVFVPKIINLLVKRSKLLATAMAIAIFLEFAYFDYGIFARRQVIEDPVPFRFYETMAKSSVLNRAYCTTGCLDRLTSQKMGISLLGGNNPVQLKEFVNYLRQAGGYTEMGYFPILPPYTVFNQQPQPDAGLLAQTATKFVVSPYKLKDVKLKLMDEEQNFGLYLNTVDLAEYKDHYFSLQSADRQSRIKN